MIQIDEMTLSRLHTHLTSGRNIGILSAFRGDVPASENEANHQDLLHAIKTAGYGYSVVHGVYVENHGTPQARPVHEKSVLVIGHQGDDPTFKDLITRAGAHFNQDSVLIKPHDSEDAHLVGTSDAEFPGRGKKFVVGKFKPDQAGEFFTSLRAKHPNPRNFAFAESVTRKGSMVLESLMVVPPRSFFNGRVAPNRV